MPPHVPRPESIEIAHEQLVELSDDNHSLRNHVGAARMTLELTGRRLLGVRGAVTGEALKTVDETLLMVQRCLVRLGGQPLPGVEMPPVVAPPRVSQPPG